MTLVTLTLFLTLFNSAMLMMSSSLPFQAMSLFFLSLSVAGVIASSLSPLLGIYIILIYSSGLLVLLAYFVALSPNQNLNSPSIPNLTFLLFILALSVLGTLPITSLSKLSLPDESFSIITILTPSSSSFLVLIGIILIITMISVVKILSLSSKPMRPWNM